LIYDVALINKREALSWRQGEPAINRCSNLGKLLLVVAVIGI
jgi:hypothetical protein